MSYDFELAGDPYLVHPVHEPTGAALSIGGQTFRAALSEGLANGEFFLDLDGRRERLFIASRGDVHFIHWRGRAHRVEAINALERARREAAPTGGDELLRAPMPGTVVDVAVDVGAEVELGSLLMTIESMKLQTAITAPHPSRVAEVFVSAGSTFDQGDLLVRLESNNEDEDASGNAETSNRTDDRDDGRPEGGAKP